MTRRLFPLLMLVATLFGCDANAEPPADQPAPAAGEAAAADGTSAADDPTQVSDRLNAVEVTVSLEVEDLDAFEAAVHERQEEVGGHIEDARVSGRRGTSRQGTWVVRVPAESERRFTEIFEAEGELLSYGRTSEDVTADVIDVEARLIARRAEERRLLELMDSETGELADVLAVSKELARVRALIEEYEGHRSSLSGRVSMPTITVHASEIPSFAPASAPTYSQRVSRTLTGSLEGGKAVIEALGLVLVALLPWLLPLVGAGLAVRAIVRRVRA